MGSVERIHPELNPEGVPQSGALDSVEKSPDVISFEKARERLRKFQIPLEGEIKNLHDAYNYLVGHYTCEEDEHPRWSVWGENTAGEMAVLYWIKPDPYDRDIAEELSDTINMLGGKTHVRRTKWNKLSENESA